MTRYIIISLLILITSIPNSLSAQYSITWEYQNLGPKVNMSLEYIPWAEGIFGTDANNIINRVELDTSGVITLTGRDLPSHKMIYRLALQDRDGVGIHAGIVRNYIHVVLDNETTMHIHGCDTFTKNIANCIVKGNPESEIIQQLFNEVLAEMYQESVAAYKIETKTKTDFLRNKHFDLLKEIADTCQFLIPSIMAIQMIGEKNLTIAIEEDPTYFKQYLDKLNALDPNHPYTIEMNISINKIMERLFGKPKEANVLWYPLAGLAALCLLLLLHNLKLRRQLKATKAESFSENKQHNHLARLDKLSPKEKEVFELMKTSLSNKEIASKLFIETTTVKSHISKIYQKLQITSRQEISQYADYQGLST